MTPPPPSPPRRQPSPRARDSPSMQEQIQQAYDDAHRPMPAAYVSPTEQAELDDFERLEALYEVTPPPGAPASPRRPPSGKKYL